MNTYIDKIQVIYDLGEHFSKTNDRESYLFVCLYTSNLVAGYTGEKCPEGDCLSRPFNRYFNT